jgi:hypothetical protein
VAWDVEHLPAGVRGGELVVVVHHLVRRRSLKGQMLEIINIFRWGERRRTRSSGSSPGGEEIIKGTVTWDIEHLPAGVRGGELVEVAHHLSGRRSLKGQWKDISTFFQMGWEERTCWGVGEVERSLKDSCEKD